VTLSETVAEAVARTPAGAPPPALELRRVVKSYTRREPVPVLRGISLAIGHGEMVAVMGPSGSGKSTLLNLMGGLDVPDKGEVLVAGLDLAACGEGERTRFRRSGVAFVFQAFHLMPTLSAAENVALPLHLAGRPRAEIAPAAARALEEVGLSHRATHLPDELSGGERQRVAIGRALVTGAPLLLADEPTGNLDSARGREILDLLQAVHRGGRTVVLVTHDAQAAARCGRRVLLRDGAIVSDQAG
jgi:putative ABC transport system ATP-binding protein